MFRVSAISFLNTVPLVRALLAERPAGLDVHFTLPSVCADELRAGTADIGLIPAIEYLRIPDLAILGDAAIATRGFVRSIALLSRRPLKEVRTVSADTASRTSAALTQVLFQQRFGRRVKLVTHAAEPAAMLAECDAALLIGDPALHYRQHPLPGVEITDLGAWWKEATGLPFVFAFWAARREAALPELADAFNRWRDQGVEDIEAIVAAEAPRRGLPADVVRAYLTENIHFTLDAECAAGLAEFYRQASGLGLAPCGRRIEYAGAGAATRC
jgi:chorismate dehydratase